MPDKPKMNPKTNGNFLQVACHTGAATNDLAACRDPWDASAYERD
jgi:hypothetical protein